MNQNTMTEKTKHAKTERIPNQPSAPIGIALQESSNQEDDQEEITSTTETESLPQLGRIVVNQQDEFFIALGKKTSGNINERNHAFIMVGVMKEGKPILLGRLGKTNRVDPDIQTLIRLGQEVETLGKTNLTRRIQLKGKILKTEIKTCFKNCFFGTESELEEESLRLYGSISYAAYAITFEQYKQFLRIIPFVQKSQEISCFQPVDTQDDKIILEKKGFPYAENLNDANTQERDIVARACYLHPNNTCRHTGIDLIEYTLGIPHLTDNISRQFFVNLPVSANFSWGVPDRYFYVFPLPPDGYPADETKKAILTKIFRRMENLLKKDPYSENTIQKFEALKNLYNEQAGIPDNDIEQALKSIRIWKSTNHDVICQLRAQSFLGKLFVSTSSTKAMADDIEDALERDLVL
ncbi:hypothetical protein B6N58_04135 [Legionella micdadei]|nr:hypothetical protein B6N58_04135 [Legionella micdadei]ARG99654.1 hypothetical protein B6V88_04050 [Legionella micdadei]NSL17802.1 hypothetical protein [Legionella micdadei]